MHGWMSLKFLTLTLYVKVDALPRKNKWYGAVKKKK